MNFLPQTYDRLLLTGIVLIAVGVVIARNLPVPESSFGIGLLAIGCLLLVTGIYKKIRSEM
jgi:uncharacterized membrane protein HdeD (DUF308 family)